MIESPNITLSLYATLWLIASTKEQNFPLPLQFMEHFLTIHELGSSISFGQLQSLSMYGLVSFELSSKNHFNLM
jgi:hypothetical protein